MSERHGSPRTPDVVLERYHLGELSKAQRRRVEDRLDAEEGLAQRLSALGESDGELRGATGRLAQRVRAALEDRARPRHRRWRTWWLLPLALTTAGLAAVMVAPHLPLLAPASAPRSTALTPEPGVRVKGGPSLALYRKTLAGSERVADGEYARQGDLIRVGYRAAGRRYGAILSIDGRGAVTLHLPNSGTHSVVLARGKTTFLAQSYELDDAPRWESFYFITCDRPFDLAPLLDSARRRAAERRPGPLALPSNLHQSIVTLKKGSPL